MDKEKLVKINLGKDVLPLKFEKARTSKPTNNFRFMPKLFHHLKDYTSSAGWDYVEKTLTVSISETPNLDVMKWMAYVEDQHMLTQKSAFVDYNHIMLTMLDEEGRTVASVKFHKPEIKAHKCFFRNHEVTGLTFNITKDEINLTHHITLAYAAAEIYMPNSEGKQPAHDPDVEWQTVELPA